MKRHSAIILVVLLCTALFPGLAPGSETTGSAEPTVGPPPIEEPMGPSFHDWWLTLSHESSTTAGAPVKPEWVSWRVEVRGDFGPEYGAGMNFNWKLYEGTEGEGRSYIDVPHPGVYEVRTPGHDRLNYVQFGLAVDEGESIDITLVFIGVEFGPELYKPPTLATVSTQVATPVSTPANPPITKSPEEPFLPFTGGREDLPVYGLVLAALGTLLRVLSCRNSCAES